MPYIVLSFIVLLELELEPNSTGLRPFALQCAPSSSDYKACVGIHCEYCFVLKCPLNMTCIDSLHNNSSLCSFQNWRFGQLHRECTAPWFLSQGARETIDTPHNTQQTPRHLREQMVFTHVCNKKLIFNNLKY